MPEQEQTKPLLRRPLYVFDLPPELLLSLTLAPLSSVRQEEISQPETDSPPVHDTKDGETQSMACSLCSVKFSAITDQRRHIKSDFHRYNLKLSLKQLPVVDEATFIRLIGELDESISGSESSESEEDDVMEKDPLAALLKKQLSLAHPETRSTSTPNTKMYVPERAPMFWLSSPLLGEDTVLGAYRALFPSGDSHSQNFSAVDSIRQRQLKSVPSKHSGQNSSKDVSRPTLSDPHYFLCMIGGGHFAAMVVSLIPEIRRGPGGVEVRHAVVMAHKTFHRYTTRRKQGGSQSANDNAKGNAHSVGSSIRRANEAALEAEVRGVLSEWRNMIDTAEFCFVRATGSTNRRTLFGPYEGQVLNSRDKRVRSFPFSTRRATQAELLRAFQELTRLKVSRLQEQSAPAKEQPLPKPQTQKPQAEHPKRSKEEEEALLHSSQIQGLVRRSKAPGLLLYLSKNSLPSDFSFFPQDEHRHAPRILHLASSTNSPALVSALLMKASADPTVTNLDGKTPYDLAGDKRTRDAFRVARHILGEGAFDWSKTHIPSGISQAEADSRAQEERSESDRAETERRKAHLEQIQQQEEAHSVQRLENKHGGGKSLAALAEKSGMDRREEEARGLTPEMRMKLERERRARAAEERIRRLQGGQ